MKSKKTEDIQNGHDKGDDLWHCRGNYRMAADQQHRAHDIVRAFTFISGSRGRFFQQNPINYYFFDLSPEDYDRMTQLAENQGRVMD